ncbi:MAG TPA: transglycosylase domain-containing protein [Candidatus Saccharimonadales bacterium]|nr:transglycosylase domain-containing protein [Candidatus Saccharimonadales bacterium]
MLIGIRKDLPAVQGLSNKNLSGSIQFYDSTGKVLLWNDYSAANHTPIPSKQIPASIRNATVAIEDKNFYNEGGVDYGSVMRAAFHDIFHRGKGLQGGSTITEQLVKLDEGWLGNVSLSRKVKEMALAHDIANKYSKDEILTAYLNTVPYGGPDYGIEAAAEDYFHEEPGKLSVAQAAMLAAIPVAPSYYSPRSPDFNAAALKARKNYVLSLMQQQGYITKAEENAAQQANTLAEVKPSANKDANVIAPYFDTVAAQQLQQLLGPSITQHGNIKVITTLKLNQQQEAEKLVADNLPTVQADGGDDEALVVENVPTGQVTALVGGTDYSNPTYGQINYATTPINPGSSYKLYDYTALINDHKNAGAGSVLYDSKEALPGYPCTNKDVPGGNCLYDYDYQYPGPLTLRYALAGSRNVPAVKAMLLAGEQKTISLSQSMGLTSGYTCYSDVAKTKSTPCYSSAAIGYGYLSLAQNVNGYATDARLGNYVPQSFIVKVTDSTGKTLYQWQQPEPQQVVKPDAAYIVDSILSDPKASYLPGSCGATDCTPISDFGWKFQRTNGWDVAVKTGTTEADNSGLMMAMTTQYSVGSWVGYHTATQSLTPHYGGLEGVTEPLTRGMIDYVTNGQKPVNWTPPNDIKTLPAYVINDPPTGAQGMYYGWKYPGPSTDLYPSWYDVPAVTAANACNASAFSIDTFQTTQADSSVCGQPTRPHRSHQHRHAASPGGPLAISIDNVSCDVRSCDVTVTITGDATSGSTITILEDGHAAARSQVPADTGGTYTATVSADYVSGASVFRARLSGDNTPAALSSPIIISPD